LKTNLETGLTLTDIEKRIEQFGSNRKEPPERTPYLEFFIKAIDDFMLKLLLVCACVNIGFEVGFAKEADRKVGK
jgi:magnesium-transporting ATPase (P-type)